jgi:hypothetical protein
MRGEIADIELQIKDLGAIADRLTTSDGSRDGDPTVDRIARRLQFAFQATTSTALTLDPGEIRLWAQLRTALDDYAEAEAEEKRDTARARHAAAALIRVYQSFLAELAKDLPAPPWSLRRLLAG